MSNRPGPGLASSDALVGRKTLCRRVPPRCYRFRARRAPRRRKRTWHARRERFSFITAVVVILQMKFVVVIYCNLSFRRLATAQSVVVLRLVKSPRRGSGAKDSRVSPHMRRVSAAAAAAYIVQEVGGGKRKNKNNGRTKKKKKKYPREINDSSRVASCVYAIRANSRAW